MVGVDALLSSFGLLGICLVIFMETGLLIGFIFPGDTLLFTAGIMAHGNPPIAPLALVLTAIPLSAILGDQLGYFIGRRLGKKIMTSKAMGWIGEDAVAKTNHYFDRFGAATVLLARFIGVVRTLTPVSAGIAGMSHRKFTIYSVIGSVLWGAGIPLIGYGLGEIPFVQEFMHWFILAGLLTVILPLSLKFGAVAYRYLIDHQRRAARSYRYRQRRHIDRHSAHPRPRGQMDTVSARRTPIADSQRSSTN